jgi:thymidylate synthase
MTRTPKALPTMRLNPDVKDLFGFKFEDFTLENYEADSSIKAPIAV